MIAETGTLFFTPPKKLLIPKFGCAKKKAWDQKRLGTYTSKIGIRTENRFCHCKNQWPEHIAFLWWALSNIVDDSGTIRNKSLFW
jgi:hypothetical protein